MASPEPAQPPEQPVPASAAPTPASTDTPSVAPAPAPSSTDASKGKDPLQSLWGSLPWNSTPAAGASASNKAGPPQQPDWLAGAGALWQDAVSSAVTSVGAATAAAGEALKSVDKASLQDGVTQLRTASDQLVKDVSQGMKELTTSAARPSGSTDSAGRMAVPLPPLPNPGEILASLRAGTREALDLFVDAPADRPRTAAARAPWDPADLPEGERAYAAALRTRMLKLVVDGIYSRARRESLFLSGRAKADAFAFDAEKDIARALAVLEADPNVRRLRAGLVPAKISEREFWNEYFWHVRHARALLVANDGVFPEDDPATGAKEEDADDFFAEPEGDGDEGKTPAADGKENVKEGGDKGKKAGETNWDDEIDAVFDA